MENSKAAPLLSRRDFLRKGAHRGKQLAAITVAGGVAREIGKTLTEAATAGDPSAISTPLKMDNTSPRIQEVALPPVGIYIPWLEADVSRWNDQMTKSASAHNVHPEHVAVVMTAESHGDPDAYNSGTGATGLMQILPATAKGLASQMRLASYNLKDPATNIDMGTYYLSQLFHDKRLAAFDLDKKIEASAVAYYGGPSQLKNFLEGKPLGPNTESYRQKIISMWQQRHNPTLVS